MKVVEGYLPARAIKLVKEWLIIHKEEINNIWITQEFKKIEPLN